MGGLRIGLRSSRSSNREDLAFFQTSSSLVSSSGVGGESFFILAFCTFSMLSKTYSLRMAIKFSVILVVLLSR